MAGPNSIHTRTELLPTRVFGASRTLDANPITVANGRMLPGYDFSLLEFEKLRDLAQAQEAGETLTLLTVPTVRQLGRITINQTSGCWDLPVYNDPKPRARYGSLSVEGVPGNLAHRTMYQVFYGVISSDLHVDHLCDRKPCCYPRHLEAVPPGVNTLRGNASKSRAHAEQFGLEFR